MLIFMDESGNTGLNVNLSQHLIIALLCVQKCNYAGLKNDIKELCDKIVRCGFRQNLEIKTYTLLRVIKAKYLPQRFRDYCSGYFQEFFSILANHEVEIDYLDIHPSNLPFYLKDLHRDLLYNVLIQIILARRIGRISVSAFDFIVDRKYVNQRFRDAFKMQIETFKNTKKLINVDDQDSRKRWGLKAVDFACWAIYQTGTSAACGCSGHRKLAK